MDGRSKSKAESDSKLTYQFMKYTFKWKLRKKKNY